MVLVYLHDTNETYVHVLKELREQVDFSSIEFIIYRTLPNDRDLEQLFKKFLPRQ